MKKLDLDVEEIIRMYTVEEKTLGEIGRILGVSYGTVKHRLVTNNIPVRNRKECKALRDRTYPCIGNGRKHFMNFDYFKTWSRNMAYIVGFLSADGYIGKDNSFFRIALQEGDIDILEKIKEEIGYTGEIKKTKHKVNEKEFPTATLIVSSKYVVNDLVKIGIENNKSFTTNMDNVPDEYRLDFIRGYFDGDGTVGEQWTKKSKIPMLRVRICSGSEKMLIQIVEHLEKLGVKRVKTHKDPRRNLYDIAYSQNASKQIYKLFYEDESLICLDRKKEKFKDILRRQ